MELTQAVLHNARNRIQRLGAYLGDEECIELDLLDAHYSRLEELDASVGVVVGQRTRIDGAPDYTDAEIRAELVEIKLDLDRAEFVIDVCRDLDALL